MNSINGGSKSIAIMQPYFFPYAGYFRLLHHCDTFVIYDCVQFTRRSWISRNEFLMEDGKLDWLNLPIEKSSRETKIQDIKFREPTKDISLLEKYSLYRTLPAKELEFLFDFSLKPVDLLIRQITWVAKQLSLNCRILKSSELEIDTGLKGEERILEILQKLNATQYVNASGGISLYSRSSFEKKGIDLKILNEYAGSRANILDRILTENSDLITNEISRETVFRPNSDLLD